MKFCKIDLLITKIIFAKFREKILPFKSRTRPLDRTWIKGIMEEIQVRTESGRDPKEG